MGRPGVCCVDDMHCSDLPFRRGYMVAAISGTDVGTGRQGKQLETTPLLTRGHGGMDLAYFEYFDRRFDMIPVTKRYAWIAAPGF